MADTTPGSIAPSGATPNPTFPPPMDPPTWPGQSGDDAGRTDFLIDLVRDDQRRRWEAGRPTLLEEYLRTRGGLEARPEVLRELVAHEWQLRARFGPPPSADEFRARFPALAELFNELTLASGGDPSDSRGPTPADRPPAAGDWT